MSREIAVIVPDVEVIWIFAQRTRHRDGLLAAVAAAESRRGRNCEPAHTDRAGHRHDPGCCDRHSSPRGIRRSARGRACRFGLQGRSAKKSPIFLLPRSADALAGDMPAPLAMTGSRTRRTEAPRSPIRSPRHDRGPKTTTPTRKELLQSRSGCQGSWDASFSVFIDLFASAAYAHP